MSTLSKKNGIKWSKFPSKKASKGVKKEIVNIREINERENIK